MRSTPWGMFEIGQPRRHSQIGTMRVVGQKTKKPRKIGALVTAFINADELFQQMAEYSYPHNWVGLDYLHSSLGSQSTGSQKTTKQMQLQTDISWELLESSTEKRMTLVSPV
ncbi:hypothetical protein [Pseudomonas fluorescens]|uniref:hypothetical protein n=1 Tax=Pseudomonas fluorescens TaxID=294 RepID=UPI0005EAFBF1|nr:hypothetical protein [Pseudomonas fluorescens]